MSKEQISNPREQLQAAPRDYNSHGTIFLETSYRLVPCDYQPCGIIFLESSYRLLPHDYQPRGIIFLESSYRLLPHDNQPHGIIFLETSRVGNSIISFLSKSLVFVIERVKEQFACEKEQIAPVTLFKRLMGSILSRSSFVKSNECKWIPSIFKKE